MVNQELNSKRFKLSRWIILSISILLNSFIIVYSCLSNEMTKALERPIANFFTSLINTITKKEVEIIPLENININLSNEQSYVYNYLPGYKVEEIPLGSAKQIECSFLPIDATDKSIVYSAFPAEKVTLEQSGLAVMVIGMEEGKCTITAKSNNGNFSSSVDVQIVNTIAPVSYEISVRNTEIPIGKTETINFDIDGGVLTHDELINFRYYDIRKLSYSSSDESVATVEEGVIYPKKVGNTTINVSNGSTNKAVNINVVSGSIQPPYANLQITGSNVCYENDMIRDQNTKKNHYQLTPKDGETELDPNDFIWWTSNELLVKVDRHGIMRGFRKTTLEDETVTIYAKSKETKQVVSFQVTLCNKLPMYLDIYIDFDGKRVWNQKEYTLSVGDNVTVKVVYDSPGVNKSTDIYSDNEEVISFTNEGDSVVLHVLKEGTCSIRISSVANPELSIETKYTVVPAGSIPSSETNDVEYSLRKIIGHATLFMVVQIFTFLAFYMFFYDKKWWFYSSLSSGEGLLLSGLSELIQFFVPSRSSAWLDILIDFSGVAFGAAAVLFVLFLIKTIKKRKNKNRNA